MASRDTQRAKSSLPRYEEIRRRFEEAILSGAWPAGRRVPSERELVEEYGCARMTVNRALSALASAGLIVRRRRSGSFVATLNAQKSVGEIHDIEADVLKSGRHYRYLLLSRAVRRATSADRARIGVRSGQQILAVKGLHFAAGRPHVAEDRLVNLSAVPDIRSVDFNLISPGKWLFNEAPWSFGKHSIRAVCASAAEARQLDIASGSACLLVERMTWQGSTPITAVRLLYPGDQHELIAEFSPSSQAERV
ncbi:MAG: histidine utilization repressor [Pseudorhodoplanes sp.]|uniref:histidine utilization repressor n=1 Tax=Pseudorhodoplanes sp. TaxID=1934341 RepID=UPI003D12A594